MPQLIDPFDFAPLGAFNRLHAYLMCTWMRMQYHSEEGYVPHNNVIAELIGSTEFRVFEHNVVDGSIFNRIDYAALPNDKAVVMVRGTSVIPSELIAQTVYSGLGTHEPWQGRVSNYNALLATRLYARLPPLPTSWLAAGHSLGGAAVSMMGIHGAAKYFTAGQPREGDGTYAVSRPHPLKLRLTTETDPVPLVPFTSSSFFDYLDLDLPFFLISQAYQHWGIRHHLFGDGSLVLPPGDRLSNPSQTDEFLSRAMEDGLIIHLPPTYCRRLRLGIPLAFPSLFDDPDYPGIVELDRLNLELNESDEVEWDIDGRLMGPPLPYPPRRGPVATVPIPPGVPPNLDPYQFLCE